MDPLQAHFQRTLTAHDSEEWLYVSETSLIVKRAGESLARIKLSQDEDEGLVVNNNEIEISFFPSRENAPIKFIQERAAKREKIILEYGNVTESGNASLSNIVTIYGEYPHYVDGVTETIIERSKAHYSFAEKTTDWVSGMELSIKEDSEKNKLLINFDPDVRGFSFPLQLNIYEEIEKVKYNISRELGGMM